MPFRGRFRESAPTQVDGTPAVGFPTPDAKSDALAWASSAEAVIQACLDGLRREFYLDLLILVVPSGDPVDKSIDSPALRFWISGATTIDGKSPEVEMAKTESIRLFDEANSTARWGHYRWMRGRYVWLRGPMGGAEDRYGLVAARRTRLSPVESTILGQICRAVVDFGAQRPADLTRFQQDIATKTATQLRFEGRDAVAEVHATWVLPGDGDGHLEGASPRRAGLARDPDPVMAVALAGAKAARPRCEIVHAGLVCGESLNFGLALVRVAGGVLRIGLAATERSLDPPGFTSVAVAVLLASLRSNDLRNEIDLTPAQIGGDVR